MVYLVAMDLAADATASGLSLYSFAAVAVTMVVAAVAANHILLLDRLLLYAAAFISIVAYF